MRRGPESSPIELSPQDHGREVARVDSLTPREAPPVSVGTNWILVDGGRAWGPRPVLTPVETAREEQNQARLVESIELHRN